MIALHDTQTQRNTVYAGGKPWPAYYEPSSPLVKLYHARTICDAISTVAQHAIGDRDDLVTALMDSFGRERQLTLERDAERESKRELAATIQTQVMRIGDLETILAGNRSEIASLKAQLAAKTSDGTPPTPIPAQVAAGEAVVLAPEWSDKQTLAVIRKASEYMTKDQIADIAPRLLQDISIVEMSKRGRAWIDVAMIAANHGGVGVPPGKFGLTGDSQKAKVSLGQ